MLLIIRAGLVGIARCGGAELVVTIVPFWSGA